MWNEGAGNCDKSRKRQNGRAAARFFVVGTNGARAGNFKSEPFLPESQKKIRHPASINRGLAKCAAGGRVIA